MAKRRQEDEAEVLARANAQAEAHRQASGLGPSLYDEMWMLLDKRMDILMSIPGPLVGDKMREIKGEAKGIAECLAIIGGPLVKDVDDVRAKAVERWEARTKRRRPGPETVAYTRKPRLNKRVRRA